MTWPKAGRPLGGTWEPGLAPLLLTSLAAALVVSACGSTAAGGSLPATPSPLPSGAAVVSVVPDQVTVGAYDPKAVTAKVGQPVGWRLEDPSNAHTITADDGSFDSGTVDPGGTFVHVFTQAGTYSYHCTLHSGMVGTVTVTE